MLKCHNICLFVIVFLIFDQVHAAQLVIHRCQLPNGTIAFQERACDTQKSKIKSRQQSTGVKTKNTKNKTTVVGAQKRLNKAQSTSHNHKANVSKDVGYVQMASVEKDLSSSRWIKNQVRDYQIAVKVLNKWRVVDKVYNNKLLHLKIFNDERGQELSLRMDFIFPDHKRFTYDELYEIVYLLGSQYIEKSLEQKVNIKKMPVKKGKGMLTTFTLNRRNTEYKYVTKGTLDQSKWLIQFTLSSNNLNSAAHQTVLRMLAENIDIVKI